MSAPDARGRNSHRGRPKIDAQEHVEELEPALGEAADVLAGAIEAKGEEKVDGSEAALEGEEVADHRHRAAAMGGCSPAQASGGIGVSLMRAKSWLSFGVSSG